MCPMTWRESTNLSPPRPCDRASASAYMTMYGTSLAPTSPMVVKTNTVRGAGRRRCKHTIIPSSPRHTEHTPCPTEPTTYTSSCVLELAPPPLEFTPPPPYDLERIQSIGLRAFVRDDAPRWGAVGASLTLA